MPGILGGGGFCLIGTAMEVRCALPIGISETLRIERPSDSQLEIVKQHLSWLDPFGYARQHFETTPRREQTSPTSVTIHHDPLPSSEHRNLLLTFRGNNNEAHYFLMAAQLVVPRLWSLLNLYKTELFGTDDWAGHGATAWPISGKSANGSKAIPTQFWTTLRSM